MALYFDGQKTLGLEQYDAVAYYLLSKDDGAKHESDSIANQRKVIRAFLQNNPNIHLVEEAQDDDLLLVSSEGETYNMKFGTFKTAVQGDADRAAAAAEAAKAAAQLATGVSDEALKAAGCTADMSNEEICDALVSAMTSLKFTGLTGTDMTWNAEGQVSKAPTAYVVKDGQYVKG